MYSTVISYVLSLFINSQARPLITHSLPMNSFILSVMLFKISKPSLIPYAYKTLSFLPVHIRTFFNHSHSFICTHPVITRNPQCSLSSQKSSTIYPYTFPFTPLDTVFILPFPKKNEFIFIFLSLMHPLFLPFILFCISCHFWFLLCH